MCSGLAAASNKSTTRPPLPPPGCGGERKETGRNWWVRIRAVNRTANKRNRNNNDTEKGNTQNKPAEQSPQNTAPLSPEPKRRCALLSRESVSAAPLPPTRTQHDDTWYGIPCSVWPGGISPPGCAPSWISVKINPVMAKPRTIYLMLDLKNSWLVFRLFF